MKIDSILTTLIKATKAGGEILLNYFGKELRQQQKSRHCGDYQTMADLASEKAVLKILQKELPEFNIFSEESGLIDKKSEYTITVDPLDGTHQFILEIPNFGIILSLRKNDTIEYAVMYEPLLKRLTFAQKNKGAYQKIGSAGIQKLCINQTKSFQKSTIYLVVAFKTPRYKIYQLYTGLFEAVPKRILCPWTALMFNRLAAGKIEGAVSCDTELHDFLAGKLVCKEAGAKITHFGENIDTNSNFVVSVPGIHQKLVDLVEPIIR